MSKENKFYALERDGITQGLLTMFQECRQKAKWFLEGWSAKSTSMGLTYGSIGHEVLERVYTQVQKTGATPSSGYVRTVITNVEKEWHAEHKRADKQTLEYVELSLLIAEATMPIYFEYWHKDAKEMKWRALETDFCIPLTLDSGIKVNVRGKRDGVFYKTKALWILESKFKSRLEEDELVDYLPFDLQTCLYAWATLQELKQAPAGILYNMVRRVGLRQGKEETIQAFAKRCVEDIRDRPEFYFSRLEISLSKKEIDTWEMEFKDMVSDFVNWWQGKSGHYKCSHQCVNKYGKCQYLPLCAHKNFNFFEKREKVYRELEDY